MSRHGYTHMYAYGERHTTPDSYTYSRTPVYTYASTDTCTGYPETVIHSSHTSTQMTTDTLHHTPTRALAHTARHESTHVHRLLCIQTHVHRHTWTHRTRTHTGTHVGCTGTRVRTRTYECRCTRSPYCTHTDQGDRTRLGTTPSVRFQGQSPSGALTHTSRGHESAGTPKVDLERQGGSAPTPLGTPRKPKVLRPRHTRPDD